MGKSNEKKYPEGIIGYYNEVAKSNGFGNDFGNYIDWIKWRKENGKSNIQERLEEFRHYDKIEVHRKICEDGIL